MIDDTTKRRWVEQFDAFRDTTIIGALGIELVDVTDDELVLEMPLTDAARQPMGLLHGGVSMVLAETAASFHSFVGLDPSKHYPVGIEINGSHVRSLSAGRVRATARIVRRSRTLVVHEIDITDADSDRLLCRSRVTNLIREHRA